MRTESRRGLNEIRPRFLGETARNFLLLIGEKTALNDDLDQRFPLGSAYNGGNVLFHIVLVAVLQHPDGDDHIDLRRTVRDRLLRLEHLYFGRCSTLREPDDGTDRNTRPCEPMRRIRHANRADADGGKSVCLRLGEQFVEILFPCIRPQQGMIDTLCKFHTADLLNF